MTCACGEPMVCIRDEVDLRYHCQFQRWHCPACGAYQDQLVTLGIMYTRETAGNA